MIRESCQLRNVADRFVVVDESIQGSDLFLAAASRGSLAEKVAMPPLRLQACSPVAKDVCTEPQMPPPPTPALPDARLSAHGKPILLIPISGCPLALSKARLRGMGDYA
jgi:hypothetical protein